MEFKVNGNFITREISGLENQGNKINGDYATVSSENVDTLSTALEILAQHEEIKILMDAYKSLVLKDVRDLYSLVEEVTAMDKNISTSYSGV